MTEHVEKINPSVMHALRAVERGEVFRLIQKRSSKMQGPMGLGPIQFWRCQWAKLIEDGPRIGVEFRYQQVLTVTGKRGPLHGGVRAMTDTTDIADPKIKELEAKVAALEIIVGYLTDFPIHHLEHRHGAMRRFSSAADVKAAEQARAKFRQKILEKK